MKRVWIEYLRAKKPQREAALIDSAFHVFVESRFGGIEELRMPAHNLTDVQSVSRKSHHPIDDEIWAKKDHEFDGDEKRTEVNVWALWIDANRNIGRKAPANLGPDLGAAKQFKQFAPSVIEKLFAEYLRDKDLFLVKQGWPLRLLPSRVNSYANKRQWEYENDVDNAVNELSSDLRAATPQEDLEIANRVSSGEDYPEGIE